MLNNKIIAFNLVAILRCMSIYCEEFIYDEYRISYENRFTKEEREVIQNFINALKFNNQSMARKQRLGAEFGQTNLVDPLSISMVVGGRYPLAPNYDEQLNLYLPATNRFNQSKAPKKIFFYSDKNPENNFNLTLTKINSRRKKAENGKLLSIKYWLLKTSNSGDYIVVDKPSGARDCPSIIIPKLDTHLEPIALHDRDIEQFFNDLLEDSFPELGMLSQEEINNFCLSLEKENAD